MSCWLVPRQFLWVKNNYFSESFNKGNNMRMVIGIILGIVIIFNWSAIKNLFDSSISNQVQKEESQPNSSTTTTTPAKPISLSDTVEQHLKDAANNK